MFTCCGGAIVYRSKTQSVTAISSTEAEFFAAVSCAKIALYLRLILYELGFACKEATPIYEDNASTIDIVNSSVPTERARHIYIQYFAIQDWTEWGCIELIHIPGILNPLRRPHKTVRLGTSLLPLSSFYGALRITYFLYYHFVDVYSYH